MAESFSAAHIRKYQQDTRQKDYQINFPKLGAMESYFRPAQRISKKEKIEGERKYKDGDKNRPQLAVHQNRPEGHRRLFVDGSISFRKGNRRENHCRKSKRGQNIEKAAETDACCQQRPAQYAD